MVHMSYVTGFYSNLLHHWHYLNAQKHQRCVIGSVRRHRRCYMHYHENRTNFQGDTYVMYACYVTFFFPSGASDPTASKELCSIQGWNPDLHRCLWTPDACRELTVVTSRPWLISAWCTMMQLLIFCQTTCDGGSDIFIFTLFLWIYYDSTNMIISGFYNIWILGKCLLK